MALTKVPSNLDSITATTQSQGDGSTNVATTAYVDTGLNALIDSAPGNLNTLNELAAAMNDNASFFSTVLPLSGGTMTGNIAHGADLTLDVAGDIVLDAGGGDWTFMDDGTAIGSLANISSDFRIRSHVSDANIFFMGKDGSSDITALTLDMSEAGKATFNNAIVASGISQFSDVNIPNNNAIRFGNSQELRIYHDGSNSHVKNTGSLYVASETSGDLYLRSDDDIFIQPQGGENGIKVIGNGAVQLYYDSSVKLETTTNGISAKGTSSNLITTSSTANDRAGAGFTATESATDGDRRATMYLDADNGAFSTGDSGAYFYMEKKGAGGEVNFINQDTADMNFQTGGAHKRITIQGAGNVGIGIDNPDGKLHIVQGSAGSVTASTDKNTLVVENSSHGGITTLTPDGVESGIFFGHASNNRFGELYTHLNNNLMTFGTRRANAELKIMSGNAVEAIRVDGSGNVGIGTTSPATNLHIDGVSNYNGVEIKGAGGSRPMLQFSNANNGDLCAIFGTEGNDMVLTSGSSNTERMRIDSSGRVGINRTPSKSNSKLEVGGADNVGLIHVEASGNFASWGIGSNQSKFYYNDTQMMGLTNEGVMKLMGGVTGGRQDLLFNNGNMSITNESTYTLSSVLNTGALISIGANRSNVGVTYDHCLIFAEMGTAATVVANPSGRFAINSATTANKVNIFVNGNSVVIQNKVASTVTVSVAAFVFQGN